MADETILDKAVALIPGIGSSKSRKLTPAQRHKQLQAIQKKLATLAKDIEALADHVAEEAREALARGKPASGAPARKPAGKPAATKKPSAATKASPARKSSAGKSAAAPKPAPGKKPAAKNKTAKAG